MTPLLADIPTYFFPLLWLGGGMVIGFMCLVFWHRQRSQRIREREQTARELAAYVAEGSMTTDEAVRILRASDIDER